ncbi:MAG: glycosyltransferase [Kiritimatiellae bacterium]|nr:glycosyltransferase [Kiritimatiellia bacterium]
MKTLSLVVPVYNAQDLLDAIVGRIGALKACAAACGYALVETIVVDDGGEPPLTRKWNGENVVMLRNDPNRGKGFSVKRAALAAKGEFVLMSDVDESAPLTEFPKLAAAMADDAWMVCGQRRGRAGMPVLRKVLARVFALLVRFAGARRVRDTQCGFKLFRMSAMRPVFEAQKIDRFAFDVELVARAQRMGGRVCSARIEWRHGGRPSSLKVFKDGLRMLLDLPRIRFG